MKYVYSFIWAALCALIFVKFIDLVNTQTEYLAIFDSVVGFIHSFGFSAKAVLFIVTFLIFWATGVTKYIGRLLFFIIGWGLFLIVSALVIYAAYCFICWMIGFL